MAKRILYARSPQWEVVGGRLEDLVHCTQFRIVKKTQRTVAGVTQINGVEVFVKSVTNRSWLKGMIARVCGSRAQNTIRGAKLLQQMGFAYPKLLAAFEQRHSGSVITSYVIVEHLRRPKILSRFALADGRDYHWRRRLSGQLAQTVRDLHGAGCYTRDLQETNVMVESHDGSLQVFFTDLEDFRWLPLVPLQLRLRNLVQLDRSIGQFVSRPHRLRFLYDYLGWNAGRDNVRALVQRLERMRQRTERRKLRRERSRAIVTPTAHNREMTGFASFR
jgi:hypothetical protein